MEYIAVFITTSSYQEAKKITDNLLDRGLAACVNIIPKVESTYIWRGKKEKSEEVLLIAKSLKDKFSELVETVKKIHSYEVPEIISLAIQDGSKDYLDWIGGLSKNE